jgi:hypothetical protein
MYGEGYDTPYRRQRLDEQPDRLVHFPRPMTWMHRLVGRTPPCVCGATWPCPDAYRP